MRTYGRKQVYTSTVESITCNKCGMIADTTWGFDGLYGDVVGGFGSKHLGDNVNYVFDICEGCLVEYMNSFTIPAVVI